MNKNRERGSISVYLLVILSALVSLMILMFDLVRDRWVQTETENYIRQLGRSAMSQFEPELLSYGLFGAAVTEGKMNSIHELLTNSQKFQMNKSDFSFIGRSWLPQSFSYEGLYHLGDHRVVHRQILERMKYMAPLKYAEEIINTIGEGKAEMEQASHYLEMGKQLEQLINEREHQLLQAWQIIEKISRDALNQAISLPIQQVLTPFNDHLQLASRLNDDIKVLAVDFPAEIAEVIIYPSSYFVKYQLDVSVIGSMYEAIQQLPESSTQLSLQQQEELERLVKDWLARHSYYEQQRKSRITEIFAQQEHAKQTVRREMEQRRSQIDVICTVENEGMYDSLVRSGGLFDKYKSLNNNQLNSGIKQDMKYDSPESLLTATHMIVKKITELFTTLRDEIYVNEYVLTYFTNLTSQPSDHLLANQESEYILYGLPSCRLNMGAAEAELFLVRTAFRTMEALMQPNLVAASTSPMGVFLAALAEGVTKANTDMDQLMKGERVDFPFLSGVTMSYRDHLRLFFLLHSSQATTLSRVQALIELNTGIPLAERYSAVRIKSFVRQRSVAEVVVSY